jgi:hypothetical protein
MRGRAAAAEPPAWPCGRGSAPRQRHLVLPPIACADDAAPRTPLRRCSGQGEPSAGSAAQHAVRPASDAAPALSQLSARRSAAAPACSRHISAAQRLHRNKREPARRRRSDAEHACAEPRSRSKARSCGTAAVTALTRGKQLGRSAAQARLQRRAKSSALRILGPVWTPPAPRAAAAAVLCCGGGTADDQHAPSQHAR